MAATIDWYRRSPSSSRGFFSGWWSDSSGPAPGVKARLQPAISRRSAMSSVVVVLVDGDHSFFAVTGYVYDEHPRHIVYVRGLETVHRLFGGLVQQVLLRAQ